MHVEEHQASADPQTQQAEFAWVYAIVYAVTIAVYYCPVRMLPFCVRVKCL